MSARRQVRLAATVGWIAFFNIRLLLPQDRRREPPVLVATIRPAGVFGPALTAANVCALPRTQAECYASQEGAGPRRGQR